MIHRFLRPSMQLVKTQSRLLSASTRLAHGDFEWEPPKSPEDIVNITYIDRDNIVLGLKNLFFELIAQI